MVTNLVYTFFCFWIADFVLQSRRIAENKSKNFNILVEHIIIVTCTLFVTLLVITDVKTAGNISIVNGASHLIIDFITSRITTYFYINNKIHAFFTTIGFDQFLHASILIWTVQFFIGGPQ